MAVTIIQKKGSGIPSAESLEVAEIAVDVVTGNLYTKTDGGDVVDIGSTGGSSLWEQNGNDIYYNDGNVGIGGTPSRSADDIAKEAKDTLARWKSSFDARLREEPKADKKAVTLEITGGEFDTFPAESKLVERLTRNNIGGGDALLQVAGDGYFAGAVDADTVTTKRVGGSVSGRAGLEFGEFSRILPTDHTGSVTDGVVNLGRISDKFNQAFFSGAIRTGGTANDETGCLVGDAVYSRNAVSDGTTANEVWRGYGAGVITSRIRSDGSANFSGIVSCANRFEAAGWSAPGTTSYIQVAEGTQNVVEIRENLFFPFVHDYTDLGRSVKRWKDGFFSGTIYGKVDDVADHIKAITPTQIAAWDAGTGGGGGSANIDDRISDDQIVHWDHAWNWGNHATAGYQPAGNYADASHTHSQYLTSFTESDPTVPPHVKKISQSDIDRWNTPSSGGRTYTSDNGITVNNATNKISMSGSYNGTFTATGDIVAYSDARLKENVETLDGSKVFDMRGVSFTRDGRDSSGVIAQELQKIAPELVHDDGEHLGVAYGNLVGYLIEAVKELKAEVEELKRG